MLDPLTRWMLRITLGLAILFGAWTGLVQVWIWAQGNLVARSQLTQQLQACRSEVQRQVQKQDGK